MHFKQPPNTILAQILADKTEYIAGVSRCEHTQKWQVIKQKCALKGKPDGGRSIGGAERDPIVGLLIPKSVGTQAIHPAGRRPVHGDPGSYLNLSTRERFIIFHVWYNPACSQASPITS